MSEPRRVCLFAQYHPNNRIRPPVLRYIRALQESGYQTVVACSGTRLPQAADRDALYETGATLVFRPNHGLDFGAWRHLIQDGHADGADTVLLANDSVFGPFADLRPIIARMRAKKLDAWGMIESLELGWHIQSWFLEFTRSAFEAPPIRRIFEQRFDRMTKEEIIAHGELGLGRAMREAGLRSAGVSTVRTLPWAQRRHPTNPMHLDWRHHLVSGRLPFIKADLLRANILNLPWITEWEAVLRDRLGADPAEINAYLFDYTGQVPTSPTQSFPTPVRRVKTGRLAYYVLATRDRRQAWRAFTKGLTAELFLGSD